MLMRKTIATAMGDMSCPRYVGDHAGDDDPAHDAVERTLRRSLWWFGTDVENLGCDLKDHPDDECNCDD